MFIDKEQLKVSLSKLEQVHPFFGFSFLAFKAALLPVGEPVEVVFSAVMQRHLTTYFRPDPFSAGFYNPFQTSRPSERWLKPRYGSTSLQRITVDTFGDCFIHAKKTSLWGWTYDYVQKLESRLPAAKIPAFHLAVWLFRFADAGLHATPRWYVDRLRREFFLTDEEWTRLFDSSLPRSVGWAEAVMSEEDALDVVGEPSSSQRPHASTLTSLTVSNVDPATKLSYSPAPRFNLITGDNSVGKTFLLDAIWWAVTGTWAGDSLTPSIAKAREKPTIRAEIRKGPNRASTVHSHFDWNSISWKRNETFDLSGLAIYARYDGSFLLWDSAASSPYSYDDLRLIRLSPGEVRIGKNSESMRYTICNGMYRDWVSWQTNPSRYSEKWTRLRNAIKYLSPNDASLEAGKPVKIPPDDLEQPTITMPYGDVPLSQASAAVSRIVGLAYVLVWGWSRHEENHKVSMSSPVRQITVLIDEIEAHLHPRWQRKVLPSLGAAINAVAPSASVQAHIVTHSPLVLASFEQIFVSDRDSLFKMDFSGDTVSLESQCFQREGRVDRWLTSPVFGLDFARSEEAAAAINLALELMSDESGDADAVTAAHEKLTKVLAQDDEFWARWMPYAIQKGVNP